MSLNVYVWDECFTDWSDGLALAIAHDADEARDLIAERFGYRHDDLKRRPKVLDLDTPVAFAVHGGS